MKSFWKIFTILFISFVVAGSFWFGFPTRYISVSGKAIILFVFGCLILSLMMSFIISYFNIKHFTKPIKVLTESATIVGKGDLAYRVTLRTSSELQD